jgi:hypothetical protein
VSHRPLGTRRAVLKTPPIFIDRFGGVKKNLPENGNCLNKDE